MEVEVEVEVEVESEATRLMAREERRPKSRPGGVGRRSCVVCHRAASRRREERNARLRGLHGELVRQVLMMVREVPQGRRRSCCASDADNAGLEIAADFFAGGQRSAHLNSLSLVSGEWVLSTRWKNLPMQLLARLRRCCDATHGGVRCIPAVRHRQGGDVASR